jgi:hypothetical protein
VEGRARGKALPSNPVHGEREKAREKAREPDRDLTFPLPIGNGLTPLEKIEVGGVGVGVVVGIDAPGGKERGERYGSVAHRAGVGATTNGHDTRGAVSGGEHATTSSSNSQRGRGAAGNPTARRPPQPAAGSEPDEGFDARAPQTSVDVLFDPILGCWCVRLCVCVGGCVWGCGGVCVWGGCGGGCGWVWVCVCVGGVHVCVCVCHTHICLYVCMHV